MSPSLNQQQLLKKFWGDFTPLPLTPLVEHGPFIYKCYSAADDTVAVLSSHNRNHTATPVLLNAKFQQFDLPLSVRLMEQLRPFESLKGRNASNEPFYEMLDMFRRMLSVYRENVLQFLADQLTCAINGKEATALCEVFSTERLCHLHVVIREFLNGTKNVSAFLSGCVLKLPGFEKLRPSPKQLPVIERLLKDIAAFDNQQKKTLHILENWRQQQVLQAYQQQGN